MKILEKKLRQFREENRNLSTSPILQMKVQEMGREVGFAKQFICYIENTI